MKKLFTITLFFLLCISLGFSQELTSSSSGRAFVTGVSVADVNTQTNYQFTKEGIVDPLDNTSNVNFRIFPNPSQYDFTLQLPSGNLYSVSIIDMKGKLVLEQTDLHDQVRINIQEIPSGDYYIRISDNNGVISKRLRKQ